MPRRSQSHAILISVILGIVFLATLIVAAIFLPMIVDSLMETITLMPQTPIPPNGTTKVLVLIDAYAILLTAVAAVILLFLLLRVVSRRQVFTKESTRLISAISLCCFGEGLLTLLLCPLFLPVVCITLAACFLGLCLHVVRQVIEEATQIKCENDFTI